MRSQRQLRVGEEIRHALATVLMRGDVPWGAGFDAPMVTITEVQISPDLRNATAFVMPLGGAHVEETVKSLNNLVGFFRHAIAKAVNLRQVPKLHFEADNSFAYAARIERILHEPTVARDLGKAAGDEPDYGQENDERNNERNDPEE
ncbi:MAG: 30S ribosome-binding factor RbfA [Pseudomonadota bacterium]|nr:30S ribosome-binding factor RbfA [Pseudomonadota bacterium]